MIPPTDHIRSHDLHSSVWAVHGATGQPVENYPFHLRVNVEAPVLLLGLPIEGNAYTLHVVSFRINNLKLVFHVCEN